MAHDQAPAFRSDPDGRPVKRLARRCLGALPDGIREALARHVPALPVARPIDRPESAYDVAHFERFYAKPDPWRLGGNSNEERKYGLTLELAGSGPFRRALEIGCGEGHFTELLAPRCEELVAVDISARAIERARQRCRDLPQVTCLRAVLPASYPGGSFDLVVASDVLYFWAPDDLLRAIARIEESLEPGGRFISLHYALRVNAVSSGDAVHDMLRAHHVLTNVLEESYEIGEGRPYLVDVWEKPTASAAQ